MYHLNISTSLDSPQSAAFERLERLFSNHDSETEMRFTMRAPLTVPGLHVGVTLDRDVIGTVSPLGENRRAYNLGWRPAEAGPFPTFAGALFVAQDEDIADRSILTLDGHYEAPLGVAGDVFDALLGKHIAEAAGRDLLSRLSNAIEEPQASATAPALG